MSYLKEGWQEKGEVNFYVNCLRETSKRLDHIKRELTSINCDVMDWFDDNVSDELIRFEKRIDEMAIGMWVEAHKIDKNRG